MENDGGKKLQVSCPSTRTAEFREGLNTTAPGPVLCPLLFASVKWHLFVLTPSAGKSLELEEHLLLSLAVNVFFTLVLQ